MIYDDNYIMLMKVDYETKVYVWVKDGDNEIS